MAPVLSVLVPDTVMLPLMPFAWPMASVAPLARAKAPVPLIVVAPIVISAPLLTVKAPGALMVSLAVKESPAIFALVTFPVSVVGSPLPVTCAVVPL